jgi:hypothetical protein
VIYRWGKVGQKQSSAPPGAKEIILGPRWALSSRGSMLRFRPFGTGTPCAAYPPINPEKCVVRKKTSDFANEFGVLSHGLLTKPCF